ncbi:MAG: HIT family protein [archaeon]
MSSQKEDNCLFCRIIRKEIPAYIVYEDNKIIAFLDINPVNPGHTLVVPKTHIDNLGEMDNDSVNIVFNEARDIANIIMKAMNAPGFNLMVNNKKAAGQLIDHVHVHIIPRFEGDGYEHWHGKKLDDGEMKRISQLISNSLK